MEHRSAGTRARAACHPPTREPSLTYFTAQGDWLHMATLLRQRSAISPCRTGPWLTPPPPSQDLARLVAGIAVNTARQALAGAPWVILKLG